MDGIQKLLIGVIIVLTVLMLVVGLQVFLVVIDLRRAIKKLNHILEDTMLGGGLVRAEKLTGIMELFKKNKKLGGKGSGIGEV